MPDIKIITSKPVALDSLDHTRPLGTANDNSFNLKFNKKLFKIIPKAELSVLDLGCAGGGFVKSIIDAGILAVGVEGSDYSKKRQRAEWKTIPDYLFTADITEPFQLLLTNPNGGEDKLKFSLITAWEVLEHIKENQIADVFKNIERHLSPAGIIIFSIPATKGTFGHHQTIKNKKWWLKKFLDLGFTNHQTAIGYFGRVWIRGGYDIPKKFHFVLTRTGEQQKLIDKLKALPPLISLRIFLLNLTRPLIIIGLLLLRPLIRGLIDLKNEIYGLLKKIYSIIKLK